MAEVIIDYVSAHREPFTYQIVFVKSCKTSIIVIKIGNSYPG